MLSTVWLTASLMSRAVIVGSRAIRRANSIVRSPRSASGNTLLTMPSRAGRALRDRLLGAHVVPRREHRPHPAQDHDPHLVVGLRPQERVVELDQEPPVLRVPGVGPVEHDASDAALVQRLVGHELVFGHGPPLLTSSGG